MFANSPVFTSFSVDDLEKAKAFYTDKLGLDVRPSPQGLTINLVGGGSVFIYPKEDHTPATYTILNFKVDDIDDAVRRLREMGMKFETYAGPIGTDANDIFRGAAHPGGGPDIAWFKDPAGNFISVFSEAVK